MAILTAIQGNDYPVITGCTLLVTVTVLIANFSVDILIGLLDPRIRAAQGGGQVSMKLLKNLLKSPAFLSASSLFSLTLAARVARLRWCFDLNVKTRVGLAYMPPSRKSMARHRPHGHRHGVAAHRRAALLAVRRLPGRHDGHRRRHADRCVRRLQGRPDRRHADGRDQPVPGHSQPDRPDLDQLEPRRRSKPDADRAAHRRHDLDLERARRARASLELARS